MNSQLLKVLQGVLYGEIEISPGIKQILEDEEIQEELQELLTTLDLSNITRSIEQTFTSEEDEDIELYSTSEDLLLASPVTSEKGSEIEIISIENTKNNKEIEDIQDETNDTEQLEAVVTLSARPVIYIQNDTFNLDDSIAKQYLLPKVQKKLEQAKEVIQPAIRASGKIGLPNDLAVNYIGTGWLVADDVIVTNRHVAMKFATGQDDRKVSFKDKTEMYINFKAEHNNKDEAWFKITSILYIQDVKKNPEAHISPDIAFLRVSDRGVSGIPLPAPIPLSENLVEKDRDVVVIGYPGLPSLKLDMRYLRNTKSGEIDNYWLFDNIFQSIFGVKRLQPGLIQIGETEAGSIIGHDCTTLGGNSGSVVLDLETGTALGLHFIGKYDWENKDRNINYAVPASTIRGLLDTVL